MNDLYLPDHRAFIEELVSRHVVAQIQFVKSKDEIDGKLGRALWSNPSALPVIMFPEHITAGEIEDSLCFLALRGRIAGHQKLIEHADEIGTSVEYLTHLVLHEVAHIKNNWTQERETDCNLWVWEQMHGGT